MESSADSVPMMVEVFLASRFGGGKKVQSSWLERFSVLGTWFCCFSPAQTLWPAKSLTNVLQATQILNRTVEPL